RIIDIWSRLADRQFYLNPDLGHILPGTARYLPYASFNPASVTPLPPDTTDVNRPLTIVHAPSHRGVKGTAHVLEAIERLRATGANIRFLAVENMPRDRALATYREADIVIDQLMIGWYGGLAVEAMALGKVVVCHINPDDLKFVPPELAATLPIIRANAANLVPVLQALLARPRQDLAAIGTAGRVFVERWHDPDAIAAAMVADYNEITRP
ncbi:MAG: glycosyltransferase family 1 protein, partial [Proteobacteria bacterium]|nr:glycosyltransferase family 1 protein [Pseudomonadota bacterium]